MRNIMNIKLLVISITVLTALIACGGDSGFTAEQNGDNSNSGFGNRTNDLANLDCSAATSFDPIAEGFTDPQVNLPDTMEADTKITIILMHGKTGSPVSTFLTSFQTEMAAKGYKVVAPVMPWSTTSWRGTLCEGMVYINQLVELEIADGREVVIAGHSMGGTYALLYGVTQPQPSVAVKALVTIAPGHMMHISNLLQTTTADDVQTAKDLVSNDNGDMVSNFETLNNSLVINISTTANRYLTYHDLEVVPNLNFVLPNITLPVLWFAGEDDDLTALEGMEALAATITSTGSEYKLLPSPANHTSVVALTPDPLDTWLVGLGL